MTDGRKIFVACLVACGCLAASFVLYDESGDSFGDDEGRQEEVVDVPAESVAEPIDMAEGSRDEVIEGASNGISFPDLEKKGSEILLVGGQRLSLLRVSDLDKRLVVKDSSGEIRMVSVGDRIGEDVRVKEIAEGRIVFDELTDQGLQEVVVRLEGTEMLVERIRQSAPRSATLPMVVEEHSEEVEDGL